MKKFFVDTNVILRFLLHDNEEYYKKAVSYFEEAKKGKIELNLIPEVLFEMDYVLREVYSLSKQEVVEVSLKLIKSPYLKIMDRSVLIQSLEKYGSISIDLFDIYLYYFSLSKKGSVLSFDKDFAKI